MESRLYKKLVRATPGFHWQRHEDKLTPGIPDCSFGADGVNGWVELKTYDCWPRNPEAPLSFTDLKPEQRNWATKRGRAGGRVWFLVEVGEEWFLISWKYARRLGTMTREELWGASDMCGGGSIPQLICSVFTKT